MSQENLSEIEVALINAMRASENTSHLPYALYLLDRLVR